MPQFVTLKSHVRKEATYLRPGRSRAGLSKGLRGAIAQGHHKIGGNFWALTSVTQSYLFIFLDNGKTGGRRQDIGLPTHWWHVEKLRTQVLIYGNTPTGASTNPKNFDLNKNLNLNLIQFET